MTPTAKRGAALWALAFSLGGCLSFDGAERRRLCDSGGCESGTSRLALDCSSALGTRAAGLDASGRVLAFGRSQTAAWDLYVARFGPDYVLDASFGRGGVVFVDAGANEAPAAFRVLPDDRLLVVANVFTAYDRPWLALLTPAGALDPAFGADGSFTLDLGAQAKATDALVAGDRIWITGSVRYSLGPERHHGFVARLMMDGTRDFGFGTDGVLTFDFGTGDSRPTSMAADSQQRVVVGGLAQVLQGDRHVGLARFAGAGLDPQLDDDGLLTSDRGAGETVRVVMTGPGDTIVVAGDRGRDWMIARYSPNGALDPTFNSGAHVDVAWIDGTNSPTAIEIAADGTLLVTGNASSKYALVGLTAQGGRDTRLGAQGILQLNVQGVYVPVALLRDEVGRLLLPGSSGVGFADVLTVTRHLPPSLALDTSFGEGGWIKTEVRGPCDTRVSGLLARGDHVVVAGHTEGGTGTRAFAAVATRDGPLDGAFGDHGVFTTSPSSPPESIFAIAPASNDRLVLVGGRAAQLLVLRLNAGGAPDPTFGAGTGAVTFNPAGVTYRGKAVVTLPGDAVLVAGTSAASTPRDALLVRYNPIGVRETDATFDPRQADDDIVAALPHPSGALYLAGSSGDDLLVLRADLAGTFDAAFAQGGAATLGTPAKDVARAAALLPDGRVIVVGNVEDAPSDDIVVACFTADGAADTSFGEGGLVVLDLDLRDELANAVVTHPDGRIVIGGATAAAGDKDVLLLGLDDRGRLDAGFGDGGRVVRDLGSDEDEAVELLITAHGQLVVASLTRDGVLQVELTWEP